MTGDIDAGPIPLEIPIRSLIHTCKLSNVNPFDYLTALHRNADWLAREPAQWMPWNYRETLAILMPASAAY